MKKISLVIVAACLLSSCSLFKNRTVYLEKHSQNVSVKIDSTLHVQQEVVDKSESVVTEKAKGTVHTKPISTSVFSDLGPLLAGLTSVKDSGLFRITLSYDSLTKRINTNVDVKPQSMDYDVDKTTYVKSNINTKLKSDLSVKKDSTSKVSDKSKKTESKVSGLFVAGLAGSIIVVFLLYLLFKRKGAV